MIRTIVAIDSERGMANEQGIPWTLSGDQNYFVEHTQTGAVLMGYGTYREVEKPFGPHENFVATTRGEPLREGFITVDDARAWLAAQPGDVWDIGGPGLLHTTFDLIDELYITQLEGSFGCTKFFPEFHGQFTITWQSDPITENGITYRYQVWRRNA
jgi:dihydrofolate reductase